MMKRENNNYIIYRALNTENGLMYIGATKSTLNKRKKDHIIKAKNGHGHEFQNAISTYGVDAFEWEQIDTANDINELAAKEKAYIIEYNAKVNGYNSDNGGGFEKLIYQYNLDGNLVKTHNNLKSAGNSIDSTTKAISAVCLSVSQNLKGFYWSYEYKEPFKPKSDNRKKEVLQYDLRGNFIANYVSVSAATIQSGVNKSSIAKVCRGERNHAGGYIWVYK